MSVSYGSDTISDIILFILAALVILIVAGCIFSFVRAIFFFIFSQWKEEKIKKAWNSIRYMIIWIFLTAALLFLFPLIFRRMWITDYDKYTAKNIFAKAGTILSKLFEVKDVIKGGQELDNYNSQLYFDSNTNTNSNIFYDDYAL